jgi:hypothetical protein
VNHFWKFCKTHKFGLIVSVILLIAVILRFYNYGGRWGLAYDQAHDAILAKYALENHKLPLVGPFSSAGPFQTGGEWYWMIMLATFFYPYAIITPWVFLTILSVLFIYIIIVIGRELINREFGLLAGLLGAFSTAQIAQSTNLTNQTPLAIIAVLAIWTMVRYVKTKKIKYLFSLGFLVSFAVTIHLQGALLFLLPLSLLLFSGKPSVRNILILFVGILLPLLPLLIFDIQNNFVNSHNMIQYYLHDQYKISLDVLGRRWLTYAGVFWPNTWSHVIGGNLAIGYILTIGVLLVTSYAFLKKKIQKEWGILLMSFLLTVIVIRYTRTPLYESYIVFLHPTILLLTGWIVYFAYKIKKVFGIILLIIILAGSLSKDIEHIKGADNYTDFQVKQWEKTLVSKLPSSKFAVYDYTYKTSNKSLPLVLYLNSGRKISDNGLKIGMALATVSGEFKYPIIVGDETGYQILDLSSSTSAELKNDNWKFINPSSIYKSTEEWL